MLRTSAQGYVHQAVGTGRRGLTWRLGALPDPGFEVAREVSAVCVGSELMHQDPEGA